MSSLQSSLPSALPGARDERGAVAVLTALLIAGLLAAGLWGANAASLVAVRREVQRAADLAALAGGAATPLVGVLASGEPSATACRVADAQLGGGAPVAGSLAAGGRPVCGDGVTVESLADMPLVDRVREVLAGLLTAAGLDTPDLCAPLLAPTLDPLLATLSDTECASLAGALDGWPDRLAPAVLTPRVHVAVAGAFRAPIPFPGFDGERAIAADALARRRFKNLVVLPPVGPMETPMPLDQIDPNPEAAAVRDVLLARLWAADDALAAEVDPRLPPEYHFSLDGLIQDVGDLFDPPAMHTPPSPLDVAAEAARTGDPVVLLRLFRMPVLGIPALDFTAAYLSPLADGRFEATPIPLEQLSQAGGLFGAALTR